MSKKIFLVYLILYALQASAQQGLDINKLLGKVDSSNILISKDYYTWGSSVVKSDDGKYYMFYSRWPHGERKLDDDSLNYIFNGFNGWQKYSEIACAVSDKLTGPYHFVKTILKADGKEGRWDRFTMHNPHIRKFNGAYYLYYISTAFDSGFVMKNNPNPNKELLQWFKYNCAQSIGVVKVKSIQDFIDGNFERPVQPIVKVDNQRTFEIVNNPSVTKGPDGKYYMMYKSRTPGGPMTFWMAVADKPNETFTTISNVVGEKELASEDPTMWYDKKRKKFFAVAKYFSNSLKYAPEFGALILIESDNARDWKPSLHILVSLKEINFKNGNKIKLDRLERPFIYTNKKGQPLALFAAAAIESPKKGNELNIDNDHNSFNVCIPLKK